MTDNNPAGQRGPAEHERRDQILELANELFSAHGYRKTSVTDIAKAVAGRLARDEAERGVLVCGSGVGATVALNKVRGIRASVCHDVYSAHQGVEHDDMNVLCLGGRVIGYELAKEIVTVFLAANFIPEVRFKRRLEKLLQVEKRNLEGKS